MKNNPEGTPEMPPISLEAEGTKKPRAAKNKKPQPGIKVSDGRLNTVYGSDDDGEMLR